MMRLWQGWKRRARWQKIVGVGMVVLAAALAGFYGWVLAGCRM